MAFTQKALRFFRELAKNNKKEWFEAHREEYEREVREPMRELIEEMNARLARFAPEIGGDPKRSMFRINRDTRFSKDKTPYKTHVGIYFRHARSAEADTAGLYLHLEPGHAFLGAGIWHPGSPALKRIRDALVARSDAWLAAVAAVEPVWRLADGESLKRAPAGYRPDHPLIADLKRKSFSIVSPLTQRQITASGFLDEFEARAATARPFMEFLGTALGVEY